MHQTKRTGGCLGGRRGRSSLSFQRYPYIEVRSISDLSSDGAVEESRKSGGPW